MLPSPHVPYGDRRWTSGHKKPVVTLIITIKQSLKPQSLLKFIFLHIALKDAIRYEKLQIAVNFVKIFQKLSTISRSTMISYSYQVQIGNQCQLRILINCQIQSRVDFVENSTFVLSEALHFLRIGRILPLNTT